MTTLPLDRLAAMRETYATFPPDSDARLLIAEVDRLTRLNNRLRADVRDLGCLVLQMCGRLTRTVLPEIRRYEPLSSVSQVIRWDVTAASELLKKVAPRINAMERAA